MKSRVKTIISVVIIVAFIAIVLSFVFLCTRGSSSESRTHTVNSSGVFDYILVGENGNYPSNDSDAVVAIVGFAGDNLEQDTIEIPRKILGKPVRHIGYRNDDLFNPESFNVNTKNLKKMYIHDNIKKMAFFEGQDVEIMNCSNTLNITFDIGVVYKQIYAYKSVLDDMNNSRTYSPTNIVFLNNYSNEVNGGYYRLDNIQSGEKIPSPPSPMRSGYDFAGWYTEPDCINAWDFDASPSIEDDTEFKLYADWRKTI